MKCIPFRLLTYLSLFLCSSLNGYTRSDEDLLVYGNRAYDAWLREGDVDFKIKNYKKSFEGLHDNERIRAVSLSVLDREKIYQGSTMMYIWPAFKYTQDFLKDCSELKKMIKKENDPRRFYLLSSLASKFVYYQQSDFVYVQSHMLFKNGRVAKDEGEYTKSYSHDVSVYTYQIILRNLKVLGANFEPPNKNIPHKEKALFLAKWLKLNWPKCEDLKIPSDKAVPNKLRAPRPLSKTNRGDHEFSNERLRATPSAGILSSKMKWSLIAGSVFVLGCLGFCVKSRR